MKRASMKKLFAAISIAFSGPGRSLLALSFVLAAYAIGQTVDGGLPNVIAPKNNKLTAQEQADGYVLLWNGLDYTGWKANSSTTNPGNPGSNWAIVTIKGLESNDTHKSTDADSNMLEVASSGNSIFTDDSTYLNFDWKMEWKAVEGLSGNSGMLFHYKVSVNTNNNYSAPEYQLCNAEWTSEWKSTTTTAGNNYLITPLMASRKNSDNSPNWVKAEGHWNQSRIISYGARTAFYGNGLRLLEYRMFSPQWNTAYNASKYKGLGVYNTIHSGSFFIQDHGEKWMKFRNIRAKKLTADPWAPGSPLLNKDSLAIGDTCLVDTLTFADEDNVGTTTAISPGGRVHETITPKIHSNKTGISIAFTKPGSYTIRVLDLRGGRYLEQGVSNADQAFVPGDFSGSPKVLSIWSGRSKVHESIVSVP
ncbi:MAG TPA: DUF1080 domain-containing protein [Fibrobacteria bacterium]|jgi:hypothetical protein|nr:DUF1080 domain-containing protein [Fibrobacteria bacterium]